MVGTLDLPSTPSARHRARLHQRKVAVAPSAPNEVHAALVTAGCSAVPGDREGVGAADALAILPGGAASLRIRGITWPANRHQVVVTAATPRDAPAERAHLALVAEPDPDGLPAVHGDGYLARLRTFAHSVSGWQVCTAIHLTCGGFLVVEGGRTWAVATRAEASAPPSLGVLTCLAACYLDRDLDIRGALLAVSRHVGASGARAVTPGSSRTYEPEGPSTTTASG